MSQIVDVPVLSRNALIPLFESHIRDRASIDCVLEGHFGTARADSLGAPTVARVDCGPFTAFAGDAAASAAASAVADLIGCAPVDWVTPETSAWRSALERAFPSRIRAIPFVTFSSAALDTDALDRLAQSLPSGYMLLRLDAELAGRLIAQMKKGWLLDSYRVARRLPPPRDRLRRDVWRRDRRECIVGHSEFERDRYRHRDCRRAPPQGPWDCRRSRARPRVPRPRHRSSLARLERDLVPPGDEARLHARRLVRDVRDRTQEVRVRSLPVAASTPPPGLAHSGLLGEQRGSSGPSPCGLAAIQTW